MKHTTMLDKNVGWVSDGRSISRANVTMRFTADNVGETLSLEAYGQQITVPFEAVTKLANVTREKAKAGK